MTTDGADVSTVVNSISTPRSVTAPAMSSAVTYWEETSPGDDTDRPSRPPPTTSGACPLLRVDWARAPSWASASSSGPWGRDRREASPVSTVRPSGRAPVAVVNRIVVPLLPQSTTSSGVAGVPSKPVTSTASSVHLTVPPKASTARAVARVSALSSGFRTTAPSAYPDASIARWV
jgi:hypothetical protein